MGPERPRGFRDSLPAADAGIEIESISEIPRAPGHCEVRLSDGRRLRLDGAEAEDSGCRAGAVWSSELVATIERRRDLRRLREEALRCLARREHSREELRRRLAQRGFGATPIAEALDELERDGWLDESRFIESRLDEWLRRPAHGRAWLLGRLEKDGVDRAEAEAALSDLYPPEAERAAARRVARSLATEPRATPRRVAAALARRGFDEEIVREIDACREIFELD